MLTPSYLLHAVEPAEEIAERLHTDIINRIVDRIIARFDRGDDYILTAVDKWNIETLQEAGFLLEDIQKEIAKATGLMQSEIAQAMEDAGVKALEYDDAIYKAAGLDPVPLTQSPYMMQLLQDTYEKTMGEWRNFTGISKRAIHGLYVDACDTAYMQVMSGALSSAQAVREALEKIVEGGVYVKYPGGRKDTIETATARAVRTGISQGSARIQLARMDEMGVELVLVSSHMGARPEHALWQGKVYSRSGATEKYADFVAATGYGSVTGLCGANCRHNFGPYFEGMENPFEQYDTEENRKQYELEQRQRAMERNIRNTKRETMGWQNAAEKEKDPAKKALFEAEHQKKSALLQKQNKAYNVFCEETGQKRRAERLHIAKWDRQQAAKARGAAIKRERNLKFIEQDAIIKASSGLPKKLKNLPDESLRHTVNVDVWPDKPGGFAFHAVAPKGADMTTIEIMAGAGTSTPIRDLRRLYETYHLDAKNWEKKSGTVYGTNYHYVIHWYENNGYIPQDEIKLKGMKVNK